MHGALQVGLIIPAARTGDASPLWFNAGEQVQPCATASGLPGAYALLRLAGGLATLAERVVLID
jgi:hypothetical protein